MNYTIEHDVPHDVCIVRVSGEHMRPADSFELQELARNIRSEYGCTRFLFDMRQANITGSTFDTYVTGKNPEEKQFERDFKIALVYSGGMDFHRFMEDVVVNRGYTLRVFSDFDEAMFWL